MPAGVARLRAMETQRLMHLRLGLGMGVPRYLLFQAESNGFFGQ